MICHAVIRVATTTAKARAIEIKSLMPSSAPAPVQIRLEENRRRDRVAVIGGGTPALSDRIAGRTAVAWAVVKRSSQVCTGIASRSESASTTDKTCCACCPVAPDIDSGKPTTSAPARCSSTSRSIASTASPSTWSVVIGIATGASSSAAATPIRFSPRSRPMMRILFAVG